VRPVSRLGAERSQVQILSPRSSRASPSINGTFPISYLYATRNALNLGLTPGAALNFTASIPIEAQGTEAPAVEVTNLSETITVTWPTDEGLQTQSLVAGNPIMLNGLIPQSHDAPAGFDPATVGLEVWPKPRQPLMQSRPRSMP
jgi:hypothetical protein